MSLITENGPVVQRESDTPQESAGSRMQFILIGVVVLAVATLIAYQFLGCAGCYGAQYPL